MLAWARGGCFNAIIKIAKCLYIVCVYDILYRKRILHIGIKLLIQELAGGSAGLNGAGLRA
jgi:hypothetical protein